jgi:vacuolar-type H+-ATPase subunit E/Vma4
MGDSVMRSLEENMESLSKAMIGEAKAEAEQAVTEAKARADAIRKKGQDQAEAVRAEILGRARQDADRLRGQVVATTQMKARTTELDHREKLLNGVFAASRKKIPGVQEWTDYNQIALRLLHEALGQLKATKVTVRADKVTQQAYTDAVLAGLAKEFGAEISLGAVLEKGTGVVVETADGHLQFDNTLETRLGRLQNTLRSPVFRLLIGEQL